MEDLGKGSLNETRSEKSHLFYGSLYGHQKVWHEKSQSPPLTNRSGPVILN